LHYDSTLGTSLIVEMNIGQSLSFRNFQCCGAAKPKTHGAGKD
jgi:hypothetical protein